MAELVLGIDLGTTSLKAAVLDRDGGCRVRFARSYETSRPAAGMAEQDPEDWVRLLHDAFGTIAAAGMKGQIGHGGLCSQVNTHVFVDAAGTPLLPAITWQDTRAAAEAAELDARLGIDERIALLGAPIPIDASHPLARMLWVSRHHPAVWERTAHVFLPKDYCLLRLTGQIATDPLSNIGLVGPDFRYVDRILDLVPGAAERMAPLVGVTEVVGSIADTFALSGVELVCATMDGWVGLVGAGACRDGAAVYLGGTSEILGICSQQVNNVPGVVVFAEAEGLRLHAGPTQSGGASQDWFAGIAGMDIAALSDLVGRTPRRRPTPLFLPQLAGERAPLWNADLRGAFLGVDSGMTTADFGRAVYEGVALSARHLLDALEASAGVSSEMLCCGGGGFQSDVWAQIRADVLNRRLMRLEVNEPGLVGAAALAAHAAEKGGSLADTHAAFAKYDRVWEPQDQMRGLYDDLFGVYKDAIAANEVIGTRITKL